MEKELLYKYFRSATSPEETKQLLDWLEQSEAHRDIFLRERKLWNLTLAGGEAGQRLPNMKRKHLAWHYAAGLAAACVGALLVVSLLVQTASQGEFRIQVPAGQRAQVQLPDGTDVWLNSNTTFAYDRHFGEKKRTVRLDGEAYFDVQHDKKRPFSVETAECDIEVLGTKFNVQAYDRLGTAETYVMDGLVKVIASDSLASPILLTTGELAVLDDNGITKSKQKSEPNPWWDNGILSFQDEPIAHVMQTLSAYYGVDIEMQYKGEADYRCSAKFYYNDGVDYILKIIQHEVHYEIIRTDENRIVLK